MRYNELPVGSFFKFWFEKNSEWVYQKIGDGKLLCVQAPRVYSGAVNCFSPISRELINAVVQQVSTREAYSE